MESLYKVQNLRPVLCPKCNRQTLEAFWEKVENESLYMGDEFFQVYDYHYCYGTVCEVCGESRLENISEEQMRRMIKYFG